MTSQDCDDHGVFPFEELPAEIRNMVYEHYFNASGSVFIRHRRPGKGAKFRLQATKETAIVRRGKGQAATKLVPYLPKSGTAILRLNRQCYQEAVQYLYDLNMLTFATVPAFEQFIKEAASGVKYLKRIRIEVWGGASMARAMRKFKGAKRLEKLELSVAACTCLGKRSPVFSLDRLRRGLGPFLASKGRNLRRKERLEVISLKVHMPNSTSDDKWLAPLNGLLNKTLTQFFPTTMGNKIMAEIACEPFGSCGTDQWTFKSYYIRWLALTAQLVPSTADTIWPYIEASGKDAAGKCDGGTDGVTCGFEWDTTAWDGTYGVGQQMSALSAVQANLITASNLRVPYTADTGGTSTGDPNAGTTDGHGSSPEGSIYSRCITSGDKAGAGVLTALALVGTLGGAYFLVT